MKNVLLSFMISFLTLSLFTPAGKTAETTITTYNSCGLIEEFVSLKETAGQILEVAQNIHSVMSQIASVAGLKTIIFLILTLILASGIYPTGILEGKPLFVFSVLLLDLGWLFLLSPFYEEPGGVIKDVLNANIRILLPFFIFYGLRFFFVLGSKKISALYHQKDVTKKHIKGLFNTYLSSSARFCSSLSDNISESGNKTVTMSRETLKEAGRLKAVLEEILEKEQESEI